MNQTVVQGKENRTLDVFKAIACVLVTEAHLPSVFSDPMKEMYFFQWFIRFCVPLFFVSSGYFFYRSKNKEKALKRILLLFVLGYFLFLPKILSGATDLSDMISKVRWNLLIGYEHLWYLSAALEAMLLWYILEKIPVFSRILCKIGIPACVMLLLCGAILDEYYRLFDGGMIRSAGEFLAVFGGPRNVVFMGFPLMFLGGALAQYENSIRKIPTWLMVASWVTFRALAFWECGFLSGRLGWDFTADLSLFGPWTALILFALSFRIRVPISEEVAKGLRKMSEYVYILHPMVSAQISACITLSPLAHWGVTVVMCCILYLLLEKNLNLKK